MAEEKYHPGKSRARGFLKQLEINLPAHIVERIDALVTKRQVSDPQLSRSALLRGWILDWAGQDEPSLPTWSRLQRVKIWLEKDELATVNGVLSSKPRRRKQVLQAVVLDRLETERVPEPPEANVTELGIKSPPSRPEPKKRPVD